MMRKLFGRGIVLTVLLSGVLGFVHAGPFDSCVEYIKLGVPGHQGNPLCRKGYALAHNPETKTPNWVAEHLTREKATAVRARSNNFQPDPDLDEGERAELVDYAKSGFDRGHMAPAGDMRWDEQAMSESFYLSNMSPQIGVGMNRGIWKDLEEKIREWAIQRGNLYIYTGPIYEGSVTKTIGKNKVAVPTHFYKIVYDPTHVEAIAFIMPNEKLKTSDMPNYIVSIREIESKTKLNFLSKLKKHIQDVVETIRAEGLWDSSSTP